jgi:hypothetical protein
MDNFFDAKLFDFVEDGSGHKYPVHYRELGEKEGHLYAKKVSWADVVINDVPLEQTFEFEDGINAIQMCRDTEDHGIIVVNERNMPIDLVDDDVDDPCQEKWLNRLDKVCPMTYKEAKKTKKKMKYIVKPKRRSESEKQEKEYDMFQELIETNDHGPMKFNTFQVWSDSQDRQGKKTFCPPEHWLTPEVRWDLIWSAMDEIEYGYKRKYHYVKPGRYFHSPPHIRDFFTGPSIYFYDPDSDDLNMNFDYSTDYIDGYVGVGLTDKVFPYWERTGAGGKMSQCTSTSQVRLDRATNEFVNDPGPITFLEYQKRWYEHEDGPSALPRYSSAKLSQRSQAPMPHL